MSWGSFDTSALSKKEAYRLALDALAGMFSGLERPADATAVMASICSLVKTLQRHVFWAGFYRLKDGRLLIGPYQGTPGCVEIALDRGICGRAARERRVVIVDDVLSDPDHIACDPRSRSEIVLPVFDDAGSLYGVFDADSDNPAAFDSDDARGLSAMLEFLSRFLRASV